MYYFEDIIKEIEENLTREIDISKLAKKATMSVYEFRRIFSFIAKISFGEYIRKRRLSLAALELYQTKCNITEISLKYGYNSPSSFTRAFKEFHGISPAEVIGGNSNFRLLTKISTEIITKGGNDIKYSIFEEEAFTVSGLLCKSPMTDTECCEDAWKEFYNSKISEDICKENDKIYAVYINGNDFVNCIIGSKCDNYNDKTKIPKSKWAKFTLNTTDDGYVNEFYKNILNGWLISSGFIKNNDIPNIEVFPSNMDEDTFEWEIWIPIRKAEK